MVRNAILNVHLNAYSAGRWWDECPGLLNPWEPSELKELIGIFSGSSFLHENGFSRLHKAVLRNQPARLREELELSSKDIDQIDAQGYTPLSWAAIRMDPECLEILLSYGANSGLYKGPTGTLLGGLAANDNLDEETMRNRDRCLQICMEYGTALYGQDYIDRANSIGRTPLMLACFTGQPSAASLLLNAGADINLENEDHETALMFCLSDHSGGSLPIILNHPCLRRTFRREPMMKILRHLQAWTSAKHLQQIIDAQICCSEFTGRDWKWLRKVAVKSFFQTPEDFASIQELWAEVLSGIQHRAGLSTPSCFSDDSEQELDVTDGELDEILHESSETTGMDSDGEDSLEEDKFEDAVEF
jgi:Ankyrin repeat